MSVTQRISRALRCPISGLVTLSLLASILVTSLGTSPSKADGLAPSSFVINGRGNGHGRGLSQYGALGWAINYGKTWRQILNFYYGVNGNKISLLGSGDGGAVPFGQMTVRLFADYDAIDKDQLQTAVISDTANLYSPSDPSPNRRWASMVAREKPGQTNVWEIWASATKKCVTTYSNLTSEGFTLIDSAYAPGSLSGGKYPPVYFLTDKWADRDAVAPRDLIGVCDPRDNGGAGQVVFYRGAILAANGTAGENRTVNMLPIDSYVRGVIPRESPASWGDRGEGKGMHALRAQAVAARSYSASESRYSYAKTCDTDSCQVYMGAARRSKSYDPYTITLEDPRSDQATIDTAGVIIRATTGAIMRTEFTGSNGGRTTGSTFGTRDDPGDNMEENSLYTWSRTFSQAEMQRIFPSVGVITSINTTHLSPPDALSAFGGYTIDVTITGTNGVIKRSAWDFRGDLDLYAPWFGVTPIYPEIVDANSPGQILFVGDSVTAGLFLGGEYQKIIQPGYQSMNLQALTYRCLIGICGIPYFYPDRRDGLGVLTTEATPATALIALGYNDSAGSYAMEVDQVIGALTERGVRRIIFINMAERAHADYVAMNAVLAQRAATNPRVSLFDWKTFSAGPEHTRWFEDGVHLKSSGRTQMALFIRTQLDQLRIVGKLPKAPVVPAFTPGLPLYVNRPANNCWLVGYLQSELNKRINANLELDCQFGAGTLAAVKAFETKRKLVPDGIVDNRLWKILTN